MNINKKFWSIAISVIILFIVLYVAIAQIAANNILWLNIIILIILFFLRMEK